MWWISFNFFLHQKRVFFSTFRFFMSIDWLIDLFDLLDVQHIGLPHINSTHSHPHLYIQMCAAAHVRMLNRHDDNDDYPHVSQVWPFTKLCRYGWSVFGKLVCWLASTLVCSVCFSAFPSKNQWWAVLTPTHTHSCTQPHMHSSKHLQPQHCNIVITSFDHRA